MPRISSAFPAWKTNLRRYFLSLESLTLSFFPSPFQNLKSSSGRSKKRIRRSSRRSEDAAAETASYGAALYAQTMNSAFAQRQQRHGASHLFDAPGPNPTHLSSANFNVTTTTSTTTTTTTTRRAGANPSEIGSIWDMMQQPIGPIATPAAGHGVAASSNRASRHQQQQQRQQHQPQGTSAEDAICLD